jgi:hypothetical protein
MLFKQIQPAENFKGLYPTAHLVGSFSKGLDSGPLYKIASDNYILSKAKDIKPKKNHSYVHLITTGAGEVYGANSNGDYFNKEAREVTYPNPKPGTPKTEMLHGGLVKYHDTFAKYAKVYREHNNSRKKGTPLGEVVIEAYNKHMDRGELIVELPDDKWGPELQKLSADEHVYWSMGAGLPSDSCSICGNKSKKTTDYCEHAKYSKLQLDKEGNQVFLYNDQPHFHDISCVAVPADKIAFALSKVASKGGTGNAIYESRASVYLPHSLLRDMGEKILAHRAELLDKLARLEKTIRLEQVPNDVKLLSNSFGDELDEDTVSKLTNFPLDDVLDCCDKKSVMLPPKSFIRIAMKKPKGDINGLEDMENNLPSVFNELLDEGTEALQDGAYTPKGGCHWSGLNQVISDLTPAHSLEDEPTQQRILKVVIAGKPPKEKEASYNTNNTHTQQGKLLAKEYAKYQLSFLRNKDKYANLIIAKNAYN